MSLFFKELIPQGSAMIFIYAILLMSKSKSYILQLTEQLHNLANKKNLKLAPEKNFFMLLTVIFLGHEIYFNTIKPIDFKIAALREITYRTTKFELKRFTGSMNFYSKPID